MGCLGRCLSCYFFALCLQDGGRQCGREASGIGFRALGCRVYTENQEQERLEYLLNPSDGSHDSVGLNPKASSGASSAGASAGSSSAIAAPAPTKHEDDRSLGFSWMASS